MFNLVVFNNNNNKQRAAVLKEYLEKMKAPFYKSIVVVVFILIVLTFQQAYSANEDDDVGKNRENTINKHQDVSYLHVQVGSDGRQFLSITKQSSQLKAPPKWLARGSLLTDDFNTTGWVSDFRKKI
jgi:hypothetical protein